MTAFRMDHVGITVQNLDQAIAFFEALGFGVDGRSEVGGPWADRVNGLDGTRVDMAMVSPPGEGGPKLELTRFISPDPVGETDRPVNSFGFTHVCYQVEDVDAVIARARDAGYGLIRELVHYEDVFLLAYIRGPEGLIVEVAQAL